MKNRSLELSTQRVRVGQSVLLSGRGWPLDRLTLHVGRRLGRRAPIGEITEVLVGNYSSGGWVPDEHGEFKVALGTRNWPLGCLKIEVHGPGSLRGKLEVEVEPAVRPGPGIPRSAYSKPELRAEALAETRIGRRSRWPAGQLEAWWRGAWRTPKKVPPKPFNPPIPGKCNWRPLGPAAYLEDPDGTAGPCSGRIRAIAIDPANPQRLFLATATGGVWRSLDGGASFQPRTDDLPTLCLGALTLDPNDTAVVYAGSGEFVPLTTLGYPGYGLFRSSDGGDTWTVLGSAEFPRAEIARIVVDPLDSAAVYVAASNGVWFSADGGLGWSQLDVRPATDLLLTRNPAQPNLTWLVVGLQGLGIARASRAMGPWGPLVVVATASVNAANIALGVCRDQPARIYAALSDDLGNTLGSIRRSTDYGATWVVRNTPDFSQSGNLDYQGNYNLVILPSLTDPEQVLLGFVQLWRSPDGGQSWVRLDGDAMGFTVHVDHHALAWHPTQPNALYCGNDGGLYFSANAGQTWQTRNTDLSTLQLYDFDHHPEYEGILLGASQDNGGFHGINMPIWQRTWVPRGTSHSVMGSDGVVARFDPFDPYVQYYGVPGIFGGISRSDDGGRTLQQLQPAQGGGGFLVRFFTDPFRPGAIYTGSSVVAISHDRGVSPWVPLFSINAPFAYLRWLAFRAGHPEVIYSAWSAVPTSRRVIRLVGPAVGDWFDAVAEELPSTGLPMREISCLAVDTADNLWLTFSSILHGEEAHEFADDNVYYLPAGAMAWQNRSAGLPPGIPINQILVDPHDDTRVFCAGDRGVYAWNEGLGSWTSFDEGLPNAPILRMRLHERSRLLRVGTFGRGVWERPIDGVACADHFLYLRSHLADAGAEPVANGVPDPYRAGRKCWHWQSPDILVDPAPYQTPALLTSPTELLQRVEHLGGKRGGNRVYVLVHNKGPFAVNNVKVRAFFAPAAAGLPAHPAGLVADPFTWLPAPGDVWNPVGPVVGFPRLEPGTTRAAGWSMVIPLGAPRHSCVMAFVTSDEDPYTPLAGGPDFLVVHSRKVALRNLDLDVLPPQGAWQSQNRLEISIHPEKEESGLFELVVDFWGLPADAMLVAVFDPESRQQLQTPSFRPGASDLKRLEDWQNQLAADDREAFAYDGAVVRSLRVERSAGRVSLGNLAVAQGRQSRLRIFLLSEGWSESIDAGFDVLQLAADRSAGDRVLGGFSTRLRRFPLREPPAVPRATAP